MTLDLLSCTSAKDQCAVGLSVFLILYGVVVVIALLAFVFNIELPNELKGFVFYAQVLLWLGMLRHKVLMNVYFAPTGYRVSVPTIYCPTDIRQLH